LVVAFITTATVIALDMSYTHHSAQIDSVFSERELTFTFAICYPPSVCRLAVTLVHPTQAVEIFGNISTAVGTLAIR